MTQENQTTPRNDSFVIKHSLQLHKTRKRRYVRLEIAAPVTFAPIDLDRPLEQASLQEQSGTILNISGGGVLLACNGKLDENSYITMNLELVGSEMLTGIVGKVKRVDEDGEEGYLIGVEFCPEKDLAAVFGESNIGPVISSFDGRVKRFLLRYIFAHKVDERLQQSGNEDEQHD